MSLTSEFRNLWISIEDLEIYEVDGAQIPFSPSWQRIGVNLSGGADSAALMLVLCKLIADNKFETKIDAITLNRCWSNRPWQPFISRRVFESIKSLYPSTVEDQRIGFLAPELEHSAIGYVTKDNDTSSAITAKSFNDFNCFYDESISVIFHGRTKNSSALTDHPYRMDMRDEPIMDEAVEKLPFSEAFVIRPLISLEKDWVIDQFYRNNWLDVLRVTRSCEGSIKNFYKGWRFRADEPIPECGECYWCAERKWAIDKVVDKYNHGQDRL